MTDIKIFPCKDNSIYDGSILEMRYQLNNCVEIKPSFLKIEI